jgi:hypothetical protein
VIALVTGLVVASLLPVFLLELPFLVAQAGQARAPGAPSPPEEMPIVAPSALPAPSPT